MTQPQFYKHALCVVLCTSVAPVCAQPPRGPHARARILMLHNFPTTVLTTLLPRRQRPHIVHLPPERLALITRRLPPPSPLLNCSQITHAFRNKASLQRCCSYLLFVTHSFTYKIQQIQTVPVVRLVVPGPICRRHALSTCC